MENLFLTNPTLSPEFTNALNSEFVSANTANGITEIVYEADDAPRLVKRTLEYGYHPDYQTVLEQAPTYCEALFDYLLEAVSSYYDSTLLIVSAQDHKSRAEYQKAYEYEVVKAEPYWVSAAQVIAKIFGIDEELLTDGDSPYYWHNLTSEDWPKLLKLSKLPPRLTDKEKFLFVEYLKYIEEDNEIVKAFNIFDSILSNTEQSNLFCPHARFGMITRLLIRVSLLFGIPEEILAKDFVEEGIEFLPETFPKLLALTK